MKAILAIVSIVLLSGIPYIPSATAVPVVDEELIARRTETQCLPGSATADAWGGTSSSRSASAWIEGGSGGGSSESGSEWGHTWASALKHNGSGMGKAEAHSGSSGSVC